MATLTTPLPRTAFGHARWAVSDALVMAQRNLLRLVREPEEVVLALLVPVMMALVFGYVFGNSMSDDPAAYREFLLPGIFVQTMLYGVAGTATGVAADLQRGVVDRIRAMPTARSAVVAGRSLADLARSVADIVLITCCGLLIGWRWHEGVPSALAAVGLVLLLRLALTWAGIYLGLVVRNPDAASLAVYPAAFPLTVLSNVFVPPGDMPGWIGAVAEWNPLTATVAAARDLFGNPGFTDDTWVAQHSLLMAVAWPLLMLAVFVPLSVRRYRRLSR